MDKVRGSAGIILMVLCLIMMITSGCSTTKPDSGQTLKPATQTKPIAKPVKADFYRISAGAKNIYMGEPYTWTVVGVDADTGAEADVKAGYSSSNLKALTMATDGTANGKQVDGAQVIIDFAGLSYAAEVVILDRSEGEPADGGVGIQNAVYLTPKVVLHCWKIRDEHRLDQRYVEIYASVDNLSNQSMKVSADDFILTRTDGSKLKPVNPEPDPESDPDAYREIEENNLAAGDMIFGEIAFKWPIDGPEPETLIYSGSGGKIVVDFVSLTQEWQ